MGRLAWKEKCIRRGSTRSFEWNEVETIATDRRAGFGCFPADLGFRHEARGVKEGEPVLGFASTGAGLHHRTLQGLLNFTAFGKSLRESADSPDVFGCGVDPKTGEGTLHVPNGQFSPAVLRESGVRFNEIDSEGARFGSEGLWIGISRDPPTGELQAVFHNRNNSAALAY